MTKDLAMLYLCQISYTCGACNKSRGTFLLIGIKHLKSLYVCDCVLYTRSSPPFQNTNERG